MIPSNNWELMTATFKFTFDSMSEELQSALLEIPGVKWRKKGFWEVPYNAAGVVDELRKSFGAKFANIDFGRIKPIPDVKEEDWGKIAEIMVSNGMRPEYLDGSLGFPLEFQRDGILMGWNRTGISYWWSTGSGKTYVSIAQALKHPGLVIFVTRSGARIQMMREIERFTRTRAYVLRAPSSLKKTTLVQGQTWKDFMKERMPELGKIGLVAAEWKQRIAEHGKEQKLKVQSVDEYLELRKSREETPFIVVGWEALPIHLEKLVSLKPVTVIFDEAHLGKGSKRNERVILAPLPEDAFEAEQQREADAKEAKEKGGFVVEEDKNGEQSRSMIIPVMNRAAAAALLSRQVKRRIGLSVAGDSHIILRGGCFGTGWCGTIKAAYELASRHYAAQKDGGYNLLQLGGQGIETRGWEANVGFKWVGIKTLIAHQVNELGVSCKVRGLELCTTADHSIYVQREAAKFKSVNNYKKHYGYADTIPATNLSKSDLLLGDNGSLWEEGSNEEPIINVLEYAAINLDVQVAVHLSEEHRSILLAGGMSKPKTSKALCRKGPHGTHLPLGTFMQLRDKLGNSDIKLYAANGLGSQNWVKSTLLWSDLAYLLGVYLGNGWLNRNNKGEVSSMGLSIANHKLDKVLNYVLTKEGVKFGYNVSRVHAKCTEIRVTNYIVMSMLGSVMGKMGAKTKYIPNEWLFTWPLEARRQLLEGLIDTDGHRGKRDRIYYITASPKLKDTLCVLLTSLGIPWSVSHRPPGDGGIIDGRKITGTEAWCINWALSAMPWDKGYPDNRAKGSKYIWDEHEFNDVTPRDIKPVMLNEMVYDIEREKGHPSFTANNVLVHNTATALSGFIRDLWAQLDFIEPNAWGNKFQFQTRYCLAPETPVLMGDGTYKAIGEIKEGDEVIGWGPGGKDGRRFLQRTKVIATARRITDVVQIRTESGARIVCTRDHHWLHNASSKATHPYKPVGVWKNWGQGEGKEKGQWYRPLKRLVQIHPSPTRMQWYKGELEDVTSKRDYMLGYIRGLLDGDGHRRIIKSNYTPKTIEGKLRRKVNWRRGKPKTYQQTIVLCDLEPLERFHRFATELGLHPVPINPCFSLGKKLYKTGLYTKKAYRRVSISRGNSANAAYRAGWLGGMYDAEGSGAVISQMAEVNPDNHQFLQKWLTSFNFSFSVTGENVTITGGRAELLRFFDLARPALTRKIDAVFMNKPYFRFPGEPKEDKIKSAFPLNGQREVVSIQTETGNYIAAGFGSKNCDLKQGQYGMIDNGSSNLDELLKRALRSAHRVPMHIAQAGLLNKKRRQSIYVAPEDQNVERAGFNAELKAAAKRGPTALLECRLAQSATKKRTVGVELITENLNSKQKVCIFTARKKDCVIMFEDLAKKNKGVDGWWATGDLDEQEKQRIIDAYMLHPGPCYLVATGQAFGACMLEDGYILGANKRIADVIKGDSVIGSTGLNEVLTTSSKHFEGEVITIKATGMLPFSPTSNHPLLVCALEYVYTAKSETRTRGYRRKISEPAWKEAGDIIPWGSAYKDYHKKPKGDAVLIPRIKGHLSNVTWDLTQFFVFNKPDYWLGGLDKSAEVRLDTDLAWVLGLYAAEGFIGFSAKRVNGENTGLRVCFALHEKELSIVERLRNTFNRLGVKVSIRNSPVSKGITVQCKSTPIGRLFKSIFGGDCYTKNVPDCVLYNKDIEIVKAFIDGYVEGDGSVTKDNKITAATASKTLALHVQLLVARLGTLCSISKHKNNESEIRGKAVNSGYLYHLQWKLDNKRWTRFECTEDYIVVPVVSVQRNQFKGTVYDIGTTDSTFLAGNAIVHNSINLHDTDAAYLIQLPYDTVSLKQWEGRWVRFGMKRSVVISYLIAEGTVDEHVASLLINKLPMSELIMDDQELAEAEKFIAGMDKYKDADEFAMGVLSMIDGDYDGSDDD